jgi:hypothetical protein
VARGTTSAIANIKRADGRTASRCREIGHRSDAPDALASEIELERFVARTTAASGVPVLIDDLAVIEQIARVLS